MRKIVFALILLLTGTSCAASDTGNTTANPGNAGNNTNPGNAGNNTNPGNANPDNVDADALLPYGHRTILLLSNKARSNPVEFLKDCEVCAEKACYKAPMPPLVYNVKLSDVATLHATLMAETGCFQHDSPCGLVDNIAEIYPETCDGKVACACKGGKAKKCKSWNEEVKGTKTFDRIKKFYPGSGENIAVNTQESPMIAFESWIFERTSDSKCRFTAENGHRWAILKADNKEVGIGENGGYYVQDFASVNIQIPQITAGTHWADNLGRIVFSAHWYDSAAPKSAKVFYGDKNLDLTNTFGSVTNGVWSVETNDVAKDYRFEFVRSDDTKVRYPEKGSFKIP